MQKIETTEKTQKPGINPKNRKNQYTMVVSQKNHGIYHPWSGKTDNQTNALPTKPTVTPVDTCTRSYYIRFKITLTTGFGGYHGLTPSVLPTQLACVATIPLAVVLCV